MSESGDIACIVVGVANSTYIRPLGMVCRWPLMHTYDRRHGIIARIIAGTSSAYTRRTLIRNSMTGCSNKFAVNLTWQMCQPAPDQRPKIPECGLETWLVALGKKKIGSTSWRRRRDDTSCVGSRAGRHQVWVGTRWCGAGMRRSARSDSDAYTTVVGWSGCEVGTGSERWLYIQEGVCPIALVCCECDA